MSSYTEEKEEKLEKYYHRSNQGILESFNNFSKNLVDLMITENKSINLKKTRKRLKRIYSEILRWSVQIILQITVTLLLILLKRC